MASPVSDIYTVGTGEKIFAGVQDWPAWRKAITAETWGEVGSNTLSNIDPEDDVLINPNHPAGAPWRGTGGQAMIIDAYSGGCWDDDGSTLYIIGGGHNDYYGNEPYKIELFTASPTWEMIRNPSGAIGNEISFASGDEDTGLFSDGRLRSIHTYNKMRFVPRVGIVISITGNNGPLPQGPMRKATISPTTGELLDFSADVTFLTSPSGSGAAYDSVRNAIYFRGNTTDEMARLNLTTNVWEAAGTTISQGNYVCLEYIPEHDCLLMVCNGTGGFANGFAVFDCDTFTLYQPSITGSFIGMTLSGYGQAVKYDVGKFAIWDNTSDTTIINTMSFSGDPRTATWVVGQLNVDVSNTVTPSVRAPNGTYNRFFYSSKLDGFGLINDVAEKIYFYARS